MILDNEFFARMLVGQRVRIHFIDGHHTSGFLDEVKDGILYIRANDLRRRQFKFDVIESIRAFTKERS